jgi:DNA-binding transcriptional LysR family regulator
LIDKLGFLLALSREKHFGHAAEACGVTQPTLSAGIKQLETQLGVLLVYRSARFGGFTPEGERVLEWARRIVGDARAMRDEVKSLRQGLSGHLRLAVVPTALPVMARLTGPMAERHPEVIFSIRSCNSLEVLSLMENLEAEAGVTYVGSEPLGRVRSLSLFEERYRLLISADAELAGRAEVGWREVASVPLSLLTPDMQNRRIIDRRMHKAGADPVPVLESNSMIVLISHVRTGRWASVLPEVMADSLLMGGEVGAPVIRSIPITDNDPPPVIGLVYPHREPLMPLTAALVTEARRIFVPEGRVQ